MTTVNKAPVSQEELGVILLINAFCGTRGRNFNRFFQNTLLKLSNKGLVTLKAGNASLTEKANPILTCIEAAEEGRDFTKLAQQMRELFPIGTKPETSHLWRSSTSTVVDRLNTLVRAGYHFTDEEALKATRAYVEANRGSQFMRTLQYFIFKYQDKDEGRKLESDLYTWIEQVRDGITEQSPTTFYDIV